MGMSLCIAANASVGVGGQGANLSQMIEGAANDFDVTLFASSTHPKCKNRLVPKSLAAAYMARLPLVRRLRDWHTWLANAHFDRYVAARLEPVELFQGVTGQCSRSLARARALGCRTVLDVVTTHIDDFAAHQDRECARFGIRPTMHSWQRARMRDEFQRADLIRVMSKVAQRTFIERGFSPDRVFVLPPWYNLSEFPRARFTEPVFRVCCVGLLEPWKGFHFLAQAFDELRLPGSELVFLGGTGSRPVAQYFRDLIRRNPSISFRPFNIQTTGYDQVYGRSSVLVHPSLTDGFGQVVAEAMACGLPVVVSKNAGASDWVIEGRNGFILPAGDVSLLKERLTWFYNNRDQLPVMGQVSRDIVSRYSLDCFRESYVARLKALLTHTTL